MELTSRELISCQVDFVRIDSVGVDLMRVDLEALNHTHIHTYNIRHGIHESVDGRHKAAYPSITGCWDSKAKALASGSSGRRSVFKLPTTIATVSMTTHRNVIHTRTQEIPTALRRKAFLECLF